MSGFARVDCSEYSRPKNVSPSRQLGARISLIRFFDLAQERHRGGEEVASGREVSIFGRSVVAGCWFKLLNQIPHNAELIDQIRLSVAIAIGVRSPGLANRLRAVFARA